MAMTNDVGNFIISDVPAGDNYMIIIMKGNYTQFWDITPITVMAAGTAILSTKNITTQDLFESAEIYIGENGNWFVNGVDTGVPATGDKGDKGDKDDKGDDGNTPYINEETGTWWIGDVDTTIPATGPKGDKGDDGEDGDTPYINEETGTWWIGDVDTEIPATGPKGNKGDKGDDGEPGEKGDKGDDGETPYVGGNGNWWINGVDTGVPATGEQGEQGKNSYLVVFNGNGGTPILDAIGVLYGDTATQPANIVRDGYPFNGWYTADGTKWDFNTPITRNITLHAKWTITAAGSTGIAGDAGSVASYLATHSPNTIDNPVFLPMEISLGNMTQAGSGWRDLLEDIESAGKYVLLDLSTCIVSGTEFNPDSSVEDGKSLIISIVLPDNTASITGVTPTSYSFRYFNNLVFIKGINLTSIGRSAFNGCTSFENVSFPSVTSIGEMAFAGTSLKDVSFPSVTSIGGNAFLGCTNLETVLFPATTSIGTSIFENCISLTSVSLPVATNIPRTTFKGCTNLTNVSLPAVTRIIEHTFEYLTNLISLSFPSATFIGDYAFMGCTNLESVYLPAATSIGSYTFSNCTKLVLVELSTELTSIGQSAFEKCSSLELIGLPEGLTTINTDAFKDCMRLTSIIIPASVTYIGSSAFYTCINLFSVTFEGDTIGVNNAGFGNYVSPPGSAQFRGDLREKYIVGRAGTYIKEVDSGFSVWTKQ